MSFRSSKCIALLIILYLQQNTQFWLYYFLLKVDYYDGLVYDLLFRKWLRGVVLFKETNIKHKTTSVYKCFTFLKLFMIITFQERKVEKRKVYARAAQTTPCEWIILVNTIRRQGVLEHSGYFCFHICLPHFD